MHNCFFLPSKDSKYAINKLTKQNVRYINEKSLIWYINDYETHKTGNQTFVMASIYEQRCRVLITTIAIYSKGEVCVLIFKSLSNTNFKTHNTIAMYSISYCHLLNWPLTTSELERIIIHCPVLTITLGRTLSIGYFIKTFIKSTFRNF